MRASGCSPVARLLRAAIFPVALFAVAGLLAPERCDASAFSIAELGTRAASVGTAFTAVADDSSALFYNPAGIAFQPGIHMEMDSLVVVGLFRFTPSDPPPGTNGPSNGYPGSVKPHFIPVASMFMTHQFNPKWTVGFGAFTPFGLASNFINFHDSDPSNTKFPGRWAGTRAQLQEFWFQPTVAYRLNENSAIAVGPAFVHTHLYIDRSFLNPADDALTFGRQAASTIFPGVPVNQAAAVIARLLPEGRSRIAGTANSPAFALGYLYKNPRLKTNFGFSFRSSVTNHLSGAAGFGFTSNSALIPYIGSSFLPSAFPNQKITGSFTTPATYAVGVANTSLRNTTISMDFRLQDYRRFQSVPLNFSVNTANSTTSALPAEDRLVFNFRNSYVFGLGVARDIRPDTQLRIGYIYDRSPVVDESVGPLFPDANRNSFTVGGTRKRGEKTYSFFYEAMFMQNRVTNVAANAAQGTNGDYHSFVHLAGLSMQFDATNWIGKKKH